MEETLSSQAKSSVQNFSIEDMDSEKKSIVMGKRKRLAFLDMLLYAAKGDPSMTLGDIQEEVDTFMFEVRGEKLLEILSNYASAPLGVWRHNVFGMCHPPNHQTKQQNKI